MSYKLGLILSLSFVMSVLLLASDLLCVSMIHSNLDSLALTVSNRISIAGRLDNETISFVERENAHIQCLENCSPKLGDTMVYRIYRDYRPLIIAHEQIEVSVTRSAVVGYMQ